MKLFVWAIEYFKLYIVADSVENARKFYYGQEKEYQFYNINSEPDLVIEKPEYFFGKDFEKEKEY